MLGSETTGFAIGGVPPVGHARPPIVLIDETLLRFDNIWAAAGRPIMLIAGNPWRVREKAEAICCARKLARKITGPSKNAVAIDRLPQGDLDTKIGDAYCSLPPARPFCLVYRQALTCLRSCPKNGDLPKSSFLPGRNRSPNCAYPCGQRPGCLGSSVPSIARSKRNAECRFLSVTTMSTKPLRC